MINRRRAKITDHPELYDWLYEDFKDDIPMYSSLVKSHEELLECGIGTGRIAIPLAMSGKIVSGIDNSPTMLKACRRKLRKLPSSVQERIHPIKADMREFDLNHKFSLVLLPFSTFNFMLTQEDQRNALASIKNHLVHKGTLILELLSPALCPAWFERNPVSRRYQEKNFRKTMTICEFWKLCNFDTANQIITEHRYFRFFNEEGGFIEEKVIIWKNRLFFLGEMKLLMEIMGFKINNVYGDFSFGPYSHDSEIFVVVAEST